MLQNSLDRRRLNTDLPVKLNKWKKGFDEDLRGACECVLVGNFNN